MRRWLRRGLWILLAAAGLLVLALAAYAWRALPRLDGQWQVGGLAAPVQVRRDASDVTHIHADSVRDAYFTIGYVHAQERGWQLEFNRRVMRGQLSEVFGESTLDTDRLLRTLGIIQAAERQWERVPEAERALLEAYAQGINQFHATAGQALPPEFHILGVRPGVWTPQDSMGWALMMALDLGGNWGSEFARLSILQRVGTAALWQVMPPYPGEAPATPVDLAARYQEWGVFRATGSGTTKKVANDVQTTLAKARSGSDWRENAAQGAIDWVAQLGEVDGKGSNNWVVAGTRTKSGKPLLANDPHLALGAPAIWYFARLSAPPAPGNPGGRGLDVIGATLPGLPTVVLGRTAGVAWGFTNTGPDVQDLYLERINPDNPREYRTPQGWAPFELREERIAVKGKPEVVHVVRHTRHGPVLSDAQTFHADVIDTRRYVLSLRWTALDEGNTTVSAGYRGNFAQTVPELLSAYADYHSPMQNLVAADTLGETAYEAIGRVPLRREDNDIQGVAPAPGWDARYDWAGWLPRERNPRVDHGSIARKGWHATANQRIHPAAFAHFLGADWNTPERFLRIEALLGAKSQHDADSLRAVQADIVSLSTQRLLPVLRAVKGNRHPIAEQALELMRNFDGHMRPDAPAPLVFVTWADELTRGILGERLGVTKFEALYGKRHFRAGIEHIMTHPEAGATWCAPIGCEDHASRALTRALERLATLYGNDIHTWRWGEAHAAVSSHKPFGRVPLLARWFDVKVPTGGDSWTVNVGQYWPNERDLPFANRHAASLRALYDLSDMERSQFIYQTGQSGLVFSSRYRDMSAEWAQVQYRPLKLAPDRWVHEARLTP